MSRLHFLVSILLLTAGLAMVSAEPNADPFPRPASIKGLQVQMVDDALELGIHHAGINVNVTALLDLQKKPGNPTHTVDGQEFSFNAGYLKSLDQQIKPLSDRGVLVYAIVLSYPSKNAAIDAVAMHPDARADYKYSIGAFNTKTPAGLAWLRAVFEMMAERWSGAHSEHGRVWGWIVGNEVNSHWLWYNMGRKPMGEVVGQYAKAFRIMHESVRRASVNARLYIPFDHHWSISMHGISAEEATPGRDFLDAFGKQMADTDWHVAAHPYPEDLGNPRAWADKGVSSDEATPKVTFKNLEVLSRHLKRPELLWQGNPRRIILSEQGFHTLLTPEGGIAPSGGVCVCVGEVPAVVARRCFHLPPSCRSRSRGWFATGAVEECAQLHRDTAQQEANLGSLFESGNARVESGCGGLAARHGIEVMG